MPEKCNWVNNFQNGLNTVGRVDSIDWFCRVGNREQEWEKKLVSEYLSELGLKDYPIRCVFDADEVKDCLTREYDPEWVEAEEDSYQNLLRMIGDSDSLSANLYPMKMITEKISNQAMDCANRQLKHSDKYLARVGAGCAIESAYRYLLEAIVKPGVAGCFTRKIEIFGIGKWPLCVSNGQFVMY